MGSTDLGDLLDLIGAVRAAWLDVERRAGALGDDELAGEVYLTRAGILGTADRLAQLIDNPLAEMEVAS